MCRPVLAGWFSCVVLAVVPVAAEGIDDPLPGIADDLQAGRRTPSAILTDAALTRQTREDRRLRDLLRRHATTGELALVPEGEAGEPLVVRGVVRGDGGPIAGALVYVFQTDRTGVYSGGGGNATNGDSLNPRIFGYIKTDAAGQYAFRTIRPGPYPGSGPPAHIHFEIAAQGFATKATEILFADCPRMTDEQRGFARRAGIPVVRPELDGDVLRVTADFDLGM